MATKDKAPALALVFGKAKGGSTPPEAESDEDETVPADFEDYAVQAFPEVEDNHERLRALYRMVKSCVGG